MILKEFSLNASPIWNQDNKINFQFICFQGGLL